MNKTYFMKTFNLNINLFVLFTFSLVTTFISLMFDTPIETGKLDLLNKIPILFEKIYKISLTATLVLTIFILISVTFEIRDRLKKDTLTNYFISITKTLKFRRFICQSERINNSNGFHNKATRNPIYIDFNNAVRKAVVDVHEHQTLIFIKIPHSQQAQKILRDMEELIKEEISTCNPDYYFSTPQRISNQLWFTGTKR